MSELTKIDKGFSIFFSSIALLHVARKISRNDFGDDLMDILSTLWGHNFNQYSVLSRCKTELNTSDLVDLLQKSAVENVTTYRQLTVPVFASVATIVKTDFEALYAYKRGDYQRCRQLSTQNVLTLLYCRSLHTISTLHPEYIQLLDDDIVSLIALMRVINPECRNHAHYTCITQLTLSLYLMTQCQLKLHHFVTSLAQTLYYIEVAQRRHPPERTLDHLLLKFIEHKNYRTMY